MYLFNKLLNKRNKSLPILLILLLALFTNQPASAANPPPVQAFFVPLPEDQILNAFKSIFPGDAVCNLGFPSPSPQNPIQTYLSIAISGNNTLIYYDQWEDGGYDADIANPVNLYIDPINPSGTQIWGDGNPANGAHPDFPADVLNAGDILILENQVSTADLSVIDFDGRDRFAASRTIAVTRAAWASGADTLLAGAVAIFDESRWGTHYTVPIGEDMPTLGENSDADMFNYSGIAVMARQDNTELLIDGTLVATLDKGQSHLVNGGVNVGTQIDTNKPVQVQLLTGHVCSVYEGRWFTLYPENQWSSSYYSPVSTPNSWVTSVFLHNPNPDAITINWETAAGAETSFDILAGETVSQPIPNHSGVHFEAVGGEKFVPITAVDSTIDLLGRPHDWGFSPLAEDRLTQQILVGWGPGQDPSQATLENGSPVWITPLCQTFVYVDLDGDGTPDKVDFNGDGDTDDIHQGHDENSSDEGTQVERLVSLRIYDPNDFDQTGLRVFTLDAAAGSGNTGCKIAAAWGQAAHASPGAPAIDVGTIVPPLTTFEATKAAELLDDIDGNGQYSAGDLVRYTITIRNISSLPLPEVTLEDILPSFINYVLDTTTVDLGSGPSSIPDAGLTPFPLDEGAVSLGALPAGDEMTMSFEVEIDPAVPNTTAEIENIATVTVDDISENPAIAFPLSTPPTTTELSIGDFIWLDEDQDGQQGEEESGIADVTVNLYAADGTTFLASTLTDADGLYQFDDSNVSASLAPLTDYIIKLDNDFDYATGGVLRDKFLTIRDRDTADVLDSDARYDELGFPTIFATTEAAGQNLNFDFGLFSASCKSDISIVEISEDFSTAVLENKSSQNRYAVGLASYEKFDEIIDNQVIFDFQVLDIGPGEQATLSIDVPVCATQVDLFCGPAHTSLDGLRYGGRLLASAHQNGSNFCGAPAPAPDSGRIEGVVRTQAGPIADAAVTLIYAGEDSTFDQTAAASSTSVLSRTASDDVTQQTTTDALGQYHFENLTEGRYLITVEAGSLPPEVANSQFVELSADSMEQTASFDTWTESPTEITLSAAGTSQNPATLPLILLLWLGLTLATAAVYRRQT